MKWLALVLGLCVAGACFYAGLFSASDNAPQTAAPQEPHPCLPYVSAAVELCGKQGDLLDSFQARTVKDDFALEHGSHILAMAEGVLEKLRSRDKIECTDELFHGTVERGDTVAEILENASNGSVHHYVSAVSKAMPLRSFKAGQPYVITTDPLTGELKKFEYEINDAMRLIVEGDKKPRARREEIEYDLRLDSAEGVIHGNLFQAVADIGESPQLAIRLAKLFGSEINFAKNINPGDSFSVLIEKRYRNGEYKGYGRLLAATFTNRNKSYEAFLFYDAQGRPQYYNSKGENLHKAFLQSPLAVTRVTSRFSHRRFHPIIGTARPHLGVDYGAPVGTPVKSVGDGTVTSRGWAGGYGNQVVIQHPSGMESLYSHLSGFSRGLRPGQKVSQGQVIGYVGSTGLSTGPHLDFRLRRNNVFIDPAKAINPRSTPVAASSMAAFKKLVEIEKACLAGEKNFENYSLDSILPVAVSFSANTEEDKGVEKPERKPQRTVTARPQKRLTRVKASSRARVANSGKAKQKKRRR